MRRCLSACEKMPGKQDTSVVTSVSSEHRLVPRIWLPAAPRCGGWQRVYFSWYSSSSMEKHVALVLVIIHFLQVTLDPHSRNFLMLWVKVVIVGDLSPPHGRPYCPRFTPPPRTVNNMTSRAFFFLYFHFNRFKL